MIQPTQERRIANLLSSFEKGIVISARRSTGSLFKIRIGSKHENYVGKSDSTLSILVGDCSWMIYAANEHNTTNDSSYDVIDDTMRKLLNKDVQLLRLSKDGLLLIDLDRVIVKINTINECQEEEDPLILLLDNSDNKAQAWTVKRDRSVDYWEGIKPQLRKRRQT